MVIKCTKGQELGEREDFNSSVPDFTEKVGGRKHADECTEQALLKMPFSA